MNIIHIIQISAMIICVWVISGIFANTIIDSMLLPWRLNVKSKYQKFIVFGSIIGLIFFVYMMIFHRNTFLE